MRQVIGLYASCYDIGNTPLRKIFPSARPDPFSPDAWPFAFFYGCLHFTTYIWPDKFFDLGRNGKDVSKRPYITLDLPRFVL